MSKRIARRRRKAGIKQQRTGRRKLIITVCLPLCILLAGISAARWPALSIMTRPSAPAPPGNFNANSPSKEYIYAGGRLIATEEPSTANGPAPAAPTSLAATAVSSNSVTISWQAPADTSLIDHYEVERAESYQGPFTRITPDPGPGASSMPDNGVTTGKAYLYRVRAVNATGQASDYRMDLATAIVFTDQLTSSTPIRAQHLIELRQAVNAVRHLAGLPAATWTYADPVSSPPEQRRGIYLEDVTDLRTQLNPALQALGINQDYPANPPLARGGPVNKEHFQQIRDRVK